MQIYIKMSYSSCEIVEKTKNIEFDGIFVKEICFYSLQLLNYFKNIYNFVG